jgi:hypothetical protein
LQEALGALSVQLGATELALLEAAVPKGSASGDRYPAGKMSELGL